MNPTFRNPDHVQKAKLSSAINLAAGIWLFVSPWVYVAFHNTAAWNSWICGALIAIFAAIRIANPEGSPFFSWLNFLLGIWVVASPWVYGYTAYQGRMINSICVGAVVVIMAISSMKATPTTPLERPL